MSTSDKPPTQVDPELIEDFERRGTQIARRMADAVIAEVPVYSAVAGTPLEAEIVAHCLDHVEAFTGWARENCRRSALDLEFVRERARARVPTPIPISALLRTYVIGQRITWSELAIHGDVQPRDADSLLAATTACFEYADAITTELAAAYVAAEVESVGTEERIRRNLVESLLAGGDRAAAVADRFVALGLGPPAGHVVLIAIPSHPDLEVAERLHRTIARAVGVGPGRGLASPRHDEVVAVVPLGGSDPDAVRASVEAAIAEASEPPSRVGIGLPGSRAEDVARGYADAKRALRHAGGDAPVVALGSVRLTDYVAGAADATAGRLVSPEVSALIESDEAAGGIVRETLTAFAEQGMNVSAAAKRLFVHPNTVRYRLRKVAAETGLDPMRFDDLDELLTALRVTGGRSAAE